MTTQSIIIKTIEGGAPREIKSSVLPGDKWTVPQRVSLHRSYSPGEWVTHRENANDGSRFWGHYFSAIHDKGGEVGAFRRAFRDYVKRCAELGVEPFPRHIVDTIPGNSASIVREYAPAVGTWIASATADAEGVRVFHSLGGCCAMGLCGPDRARAARKH